MLYTVAMVTDYTSPPLCRVTASTEAVKVCTDRFKVTSVSATYLFLISIQQLSHVADRWRLQVNKIFLKRCNLIREREKKGKMLNLTGRKKSGSKSDTEEHRRECFV